VLLLFILGMKALLRLVYFTFPAPISFLRAAIKFLSEPKVYNTVFAFFPFARRSDGIDISHPSHWLGVAVDFAPPKLGPVVCLFFVFRRTRAVPVQKY